jgi:diguanylate cyclase (GGDEF)-like protein/PAS domain S-box-containing protein
MTAVAVRDSTGRVTGFAAIASDNSALKRAEEERDRYFTLSTDMLALVDAEGLFVRVNPAWERHLGWTPEELAGRSVLDYVESLDRDTLVAAALAARPGAPAYGVRARMRRKDGALRWLSFDGVTLADEQVLYVTVRDVTDLARAEREQEEVLAALEANVFVLNEQAAQMDALRAEAEYNADHDVLTGVLNRRAWFAAAVRDRYSALCLVDIDNFKRVNDTYGHPAGDAVLREVASRLARAVEPNPVGRVGGEEFGILLAGSPAVAHELCAEALRSIASEKVELPSGLSIGVTASGGLARWRAGRFSREDSLSRTYEEADRSLYRAKEEGRDRLVAA